MSQIFYRMQMKAGSEGETITDEVLSQNKITSDIEYAGERFLDLKSGSIILVHKGSIPVALVKILDRIPNNQIKQPSFGIDYSVQIISNYNTAVKAFPDLNELYQNMPFQGTFAQVEKGNSTFKRINKWYQLVKKEKEMQDKIDLLEYKKQIILQGPPGTGKTRLAKLIAEEMTKASVITNSIQLIDNFLKNFDTKSEEVLKARSRHGELLNEFKSKFPIANLKDISKESYCIGTGSNDSFCWWIERGLISLGYYFPGSARSYLIYWSKIKNEYSKHGLASNIENDDEATKRIVQLIADLLEDKNIKLATTFLGTSFLLKILHSYYPEKYFPVNSIPCLENILKLFGENYSSLDAFEKNLKVQELFNERKKALGSDVTNIEFMQFLFGNFDLKGKIEIEIKTNQIISRGEYKIIQFHPSYSYEDFVRGISAKTNSDNKVFYKVEDRILMEFAKEAFDNSKSKYVLILDEINRANLPSVLGELIYALEYRYNHEKNNLKEASVESLYDTSEDDQEPNRTLLLPNNLYIIGTMNTSDRSVGHIDYAIRRRFAFVDVLPDIEPIRPAGLNKFKDVCELFIEEYDTVDWKNPKFKASKHLSPEFKPEDVMIGHSYFITKEKDEAGNPLDEIKQIRLKLKYEIVPILKEYVKDGILKQSKEIETLISSL
ncbi:AAA family ATPase [Flavobacterium aquicola]|uniref:ATPase family protein associated with various cellular activities (AAA) n=1 Tax=Flavobacterium aquicola TaxID=1682742 RepID=A0A3E0ES69_9FLAO|nr:AAA family ATPase [Flavobacterium aquicola]REH00989.1 ATPase family protein associated with various cellular activities (AAA) [Flavobacterium aquicola]